MIAWMMALKKKKNEKIVKQLRNFRPNIHQADHLMSYFLHWMWWWKIIILKLKCRYYVDLSSANKTYSWIFQFSAFNSLYLLLLVFFVICIFHSVIYFLLSLPLFLSCSQFFFRFSVFATQQCRMVTTFALTFSHFASIQEFTNQFGLL